jgi:hypothetical protein
MENGPFMDDFPIKTSIYEGFSMAMLNNQMVQLEISWHTAIQPRNPALFASLTCLDLIGCPWANGPML